MVTDPTGIAFKASIWRYKGPTAWYFVTLPKTAVAATRGLLGGRRRPGFGSIRVVATLGDTTWPTSIFPDRVSSGYILPIKALVRKLEDLDEDQVVKVHLRVVG